MPPRGLPPTCNWASAGSGMIVCSSRPSCRCSRWSATSRRSCTASGSISRRVWHSPWPRLMCWYSGMACLSMSTASCLCLSQSSACNQTSTIGYYNVFYLAQLLRNLGFSYQKAAFVSAHLNEEKRQPWCTTTWPHILTLATAKKALLLFGDEASFPQWGTLSYTWARRGHQPLVKTSGKRQGYKVLGVIDYFTGRLFYQGQEGRLNSDAYMAFLVRVLEQTTQPILLIQD